jgi:EAL domain-containing protein (putative c-di-GMP-specific phosphodiesterase class I)
MARHMKLRTVAEGIEEPEELDVLQQIGCDAGQGYLFQRPATPEDFIAFLRAWPQQRLMLGFASEGNISQNEPLYGT